MISPRSFLSPSRHPVCLSFQDTSLSILKSLHRVFSQTEMPGLEHNQYIGERINKRRRILSQVFLKSENILTSMPHFFLIKIKISHLLFTSVLNILISRTNIGGMSACLLPGNAKAKAQCRVLSRSSLQGSFVF